MRSVERALAQLRAGAGISERFEVARGTYADVLHWLESGVVDLAIVSPALLAKSLEQGGTVRWEYVASVISPSAPTPSLSVALVREESLIRTAEDLKGLLASGKGRLFFVDPLSTSGTLAPRIALARQKISVPESRIRYTHSHTNSLRALHASDANDAVAFVSNSILNKDAMAGLRPIELPELAKLVIPPQALIVARISGGSTRSERPCVPPARHGTMRRSSPTRPGVMAMPRCEPGSQPRE